MTQQEKRQSFLAHEDELKEICAHTELYCVYKQLENAFNQVYTFQTLTELWPVEFTQEEEEVPDQ